jgi:hypothetical protein
MRRPATLTVLGIACDLDELGDYRGDDGTGERSRVRAEVHHVAKTGSWWACVTSAEGGPSDWVIEGPFSDTPEHAVAALEEIVARLAAKIGAAK